MTDRHSVGIGLILAGLSIIPTTGIAQQAEPSAGVVHQRAPGVPMAPLPNELTPGIVAREKAADPNLYRKPSQRNAQNAPRPDRDPPMLRRIPSIIAP